MSELDPRDPLADQLRAWADQAEPVSAAEARRRPKRAHRGGRGLPATRTLVLAVAAALILVAGAVGATVLADDDGSDVRTTDEPSPSTTLAPNPTTTSTAPEAATTTPSSPGTGDDVPDRWVGIDGEHRLVVVDVATKAVERVLVTFDDPDDFGGEGQDPVEAGSFGETVALSPDGQTVYYDTCCEPAPGLVFRVPITGGEPEQVTFGAYPSLSPDGTKLAVVELQSLKVVDLASGEETTYPGQADRPDGEQQQTLVALRNPNWSPDGTAIVLERYVDDVANGEVVVVELDGGEDVLVAARTLAGTGPDGTPVLPVFLDDATIMFIRQPTDGFDPTGPGRRQLVARDGSTADAGDRTAFDLPQAVLAQDYDASGVYLLRVQGDGTVEVVHRPGLPDGGLEGSQTLDGPPGFTAAAW